MSNCAKCDEDKDFFPEKVIEIVNECDPVLFHKVELNANLGDETVTPPESLDYKNVILVYMANDHVYIYSSDGEPVFISSGIDSADEIIEQLKQLGLRVDGLQAQVVNLHSELSTVEDSLTELQGDIASEALARGEADDNLQSQVTTNKTNLSNLNSNLNVYVEKETEFNGNGSTLEVVHTKINMSDNTTQETTDALPVASPTQAGVMNTATYNAIQENSENIDSILVGAVAVNDLSATPTQAELANKWKEATGKTELVNRASIYDVPNQKLWYYYSNVGEWYSSGAGEGSTVTVNQATNNSLGIVKGSTNPGQIFVEADGSQSVNQWDATIGRISSVESKANGTASQLAVTMQDVDDALGDIAAVQADYANKPYVDNAINETKESIGISEWRLWKSGTVDDIEGAGAVASTYQFYIPIYSSEQDSPSSISFISLFSRYKRIRIVITGHTEGGTLGASAICLSTSTNTTGIIQGGHLSKGYMFDGANITELTNTASEGNPIASVSAGTTPGSNLRDWSVDVTLWRTTDTSWIASKTESTNAVAKCLQMLTSVGRLEGATLPYYLLFIQVGNATKPTEVNWEVYVDPSSEIK